MIEPLFEKLFTKRQRMTRYTLDTVKEAYTKLGFSKTLAPSYLVAGTNGKGSTSGFLAKLFSSQGLKVGLNTSPHLIDFRERIQCSHIDVTDNMLVEEILGLQQDLGQDLFDRLSFFEVTSLLALRVFTVNQTDVNVIEVGLGGRLDATNVIDPIASFVVSIGYDHCRILGDTKREIFKEKLGVSRSGKPVFLGFDPMAENELQEGLAEVLFEKTFPYFISGQDFRIIDNSISCRFGKEFLNFDLPASVKEHSPILQKNFSLALYALHHYNKEREQSYLTVNALKSFDQNSFQPFSLLCRFQKFSFKNPEGLEQQVILDVCHNEESLLETHRTLLDKGYLKKGQKLTVFCSILSDKPLAKMLDYLGDFADPLVLFSCSSTRSFSLGDLDQRFHHLPFYGDFKAILDGQHVHYSRENPWLICGSFFAVGEVFSYLRGLQ